MPDPKLTPLQEDLIGQLLADYAVWYMTNIDKLENDPALGADVPVDMPLADRVSFIYGEPNNA